MGKNKNWNREELIMAFNLYCKLPFGKIHYRNPEIIKLAEFINRTPSAVAWKLSNFASHDPTLKERNIKGAKNSGKLDKMIFEEFYNNWEKLATESEILIGKLFENESTDTNQEDFKKDDWKIIEGLEKAAIIKTRVNQSFFRKTVLASYKNKCCITELSVPNLLIASHIVPWSKDQKNRVNPHNGLCLNPLHDMAFDKGFITIDKNYRVIVSKEIKNLTPKKVFEDYFYRYENQKIILPDKFLPFKEFLEFHNNNIFEK